jgi:hypothetical protein
VPACLVQDLGPGGGAAERIKQPGPGVRSSADTPADSSAVAITGISRNSAASAARADWP